MNIEIHNPELEQRVREQVQRGQFRDVDDLLEKALDALAEKETAAAPSAHYERPEGRKSLVELFSESPLKGLTSISAATNPAPARLIFHDQGLPARYQCPFRIDPHLSPIRAWRGGSKPLTALACGSGARTQPSRF